MHTLLVRAAIPKGCEGVIAHLLLVAIGVDNQFDGDTVSFDIIWSKEGTEEIQKYMTTPKSVIDTQLRAVSGGATDLVDLTIYNLTYMPEAA